LLVCLRLRQDGQEHHTTNNTRPEERLTVMDVPQRKRKRTTNTKTANASFN
jgi:hypothetical protein